MASSLGPSTDLYSRTLSRVTAAEQAERERDFALAQINFGSAIMEKADKYYAALPKIDDSRRGKKRTFTMMSEVASGAYGKVQRGVIKEGRAKGKKVAIKCTKPGNTEGVMKSMHEAEMLKKLKNDLHCAHLVDSVLEREGAQYSHKLVLDFAQGFTLNHFNFPSNLTLRDLKAIAQGILEYLAGLGDQRMVHADIKSDNILYHPKSGTIKVVDHGNCHIIGEDYPTLLQTQCFRAPEVVLRKKNYDVRIDVWSLGCVLFSLLHPFLLFPMKGEDGSLEASKQHIEMIVKIRGLPSYENLSDCKFAETFFRIDHENRRVIGLQWEVPWKPAVHPMKKEESIRNPEMRKFFDLIHRMIAWNRPTPRELLQDPFFHDEFSFRLQVNALPEMPVAFTFAEPGKPPFLEIDAAATPACVHVPLVPALQVTAINKETGEKGTTLAVNAEKGDSITFNVLEDL